MIFFSLPNRRADFSRSPYQRLVLFCFAVVGSAVLTAGCQSKTSSTDTTTADSSTTSVIGTDTIATVNGEPITVQQFYNTMQRWVPARANGFPQNPVLSQPAGRTALQSLIENTVMVQTAKQLGVPVLQTEIDTMYADNKMLQEAQTSTPFETTLTQEGYSKDEYEHDVLMPQAAQLNLLTRTITVTPSELQANYTANKKNYTVPNRVHVHRVTAPTKTAADAIYQGLKSGKPISQYASPADGSGNPGDPTDVPQWIDVDNPNPVLGTAGADLKTATVGQVLAPTQVQGQWWVMQVVDRKQSEVLPFDQVQDIVKLNILRQKIGPNAGAQFSALMSGALQSSEIKIKPPEYQSLVAQLKTPPEPQQPASTAGSPGALGAHP